MDEGFLEAALGRRGGGGRSRHSGDSAGASAINNRRSHAILATYSGRATLIAVASYPSLPAGRSSTIGTVSMRYEMAPPKRAAGPPSAAISAVAASPPYRVDATSDAASSTCMPKVATSIRTTSSRGRDHIRRAISSARSRRDAPDARR